ncbi:MAG: flippase-like domain-containing protein [Bacteroidales bacterium]|jgi:uncharacterized protein (TIRG00374 family)|nr:flippase-like domain-containing protein [Bacteroidales bacterium]
MKKILKILLTIGILVFIIWKFDINLTSLFSSIQNTVYLLLALMFPLFILPLISANRWKLFLKEVGIHENIFELVKISWISVFQGIILPSSQGQDVLRIYYIEKRHPDKRGAAGSTIIIERMIGFVILCILSLFFSIFSTGIPNKKQVVLIIGLISLALFVIILLLMNKRLHRYISNKSFSNKYVNRFFSYFNKVYEAIAYFPYKRVLLSSTVLILLFQLSTIFCVYLIFKAYGCDIPYYQHVAIYPIISILSMVPITISGFGIREGFFVYFYSQLGVASEIAVGVSLFNYMIVVLTPALLGCIFYFIDIFKKKN